MSAPGSVGEVATNFHVVFASPDAGTLSVFQLCSTRYATTAPLYDWTGTWRD